MHWLLAYTKPRQEALAEEHLRRQGYEVLCPQLRVQKLRRRKWTWVEEPLFPRYLFVGVADEYDLLVGAQDAIVLSTDVVRVDARPERAANQYCYHRFRRLRCRA
jgi:transcriptional antiterminator RfaH